MLEKLAKQTAVYGISTIAVRFLSYLLTPYYTRIFGQETYGIVTDIYALIPLALTLLTMGMESSYFRFSAKAEEAGARYLQQSSVCALQMLLPHFPDAFCLSRRNPLISISDRVWSPSHWHPF